MKSFAVLVGALLISLTSAQSLAGLPACAYNCALNAIGSSGCANPSNYTCVCESKVFVSSYEACVPKSCNATDTEAATAFGIKFCAAAGVTLTAPSAPASTPAPAASSSSAAAPASTSAAATTAAPPPSATSSVPVATFTGAAAQLVGYSWVLLGVAGVAALGL